MSVGELLHFFYGQFVHSEVRVRVTVREGLGLVYGQFVHSEERGAIGSSP